MNAEHSKNSFSLPDINPFYKAGMGILATIKGEQTIGKSKKQHLRGEIDAMLEDPRFGSGKEGKSHKAFMRKLSQSTPRMIGAISLYSAFSEQSYGEIARSEGLESFFLFWGLGEEQDDLIDIPRKHGESLPPLNEIIFSDGFLRGVRHLLENKITEGKMGNPEKQYLKAKVAGWYDFLSAQEQRIQGEDFSSFDFNYCRKYREHQNQQAGEVLVALLNWDKCLDPNFQQLETVVPKFSNLTQMVDDIGDTTEDMEAKRPSFSIGALRDNPIELERFTTETEKRGIKKVHPSLFKALAPQSYRLIKEQFQKYCAELEAKPDARSKGFDQIAHLVFHYFPTVRDLLFRIRPQIANF